MTSGGTVLVSESSASKHAVNGQSDEAEDAGKAGYPILNGILAGLVVVISILAISAALLIKFKARNRSNSGDLGDPVPMTATGNIAPTPTSSEDPDLISNAMTYTQSNFSSQKMHQTSSTGLETRPPPPPASSFQMTQGSHHKRPRNAKAVSRPFIFRLKSGKMI